MTTMNAEQATTMTASDVTSKNGWCRLAEVPSSKAGSFYRIAARSSGYLGCPSAIYKRGTDANGHCKHIRRFIAGDVSGSFLYPAGRAFLQTLRTAKVAA